MKEARRRIGEREKVRGWKVTKRNPEREREREERTERNPGRERNKWELCLRIRWRRERKDP